MVAKDVIQIDIYLMGPPQMIEPDCSEVEKSIRLNKNYMQHRAKFKVFDGDAP